jgi:hypothetical protein
LKKNAEYKVRAPERRWEELGEKEDKKIERRVSVGAVDLLSPNPLRLFSNFFFSQFSFLLSPPVDFSFPNPAPWLEKKIPMSTAMVMVISTVTETIKNLQSFV